MRRATSALRILGIPHLGTRDLSTLPRFLFFSLDIIFAVILGTRPRTSKVWVTAREKTWTPGGQEKHGDRSTAKYPRWAYTWRRGVISCNIAYVAFWRCLTPSYFTNDQTHHDWSDSPIAQPCTRISPRYHDSGAPSQARYRLEGGGGAC